MPLKWDQSERSQFFRYKVTAVFVRGLFSKGEVEVRGSKLQIRCRLILLISEHPIQRGIRKECWHRIPGNGTEFLEIWPPPKKTAFSGGKTKKKLPKFFFWLRDTYKKYILQKNWVKTAIPALSSGQNNLQVPIWGCHRQLDDQHRSPNTNNKDHLVGQLTRSRPRWVKYDS